MHNTCVYIYIYIYIERERERDRMIDYTPEIAKPESDSPLEHAAAK